MFEIIFFNRKTNKVRWGVADVVEARITDDKVIFKTNTGEDGFANFPEDENIRIRRIEDA